MAALTDWTRTADIDATNAVHNRGAGRDAGDRIQEKNLYKKNCFLLTVTLVMKIGGTTIQDTEYMTIWLTLPTNGLVC